MKFVKFLIWSLIAGVGGVALYLNFFFQFDDEYLISLIQNQQPKPLTQLYSENIPGVVSIKYEYQPSEIIDFGEENNSINGGTGIFFDTKGTILTNSHVLAAGVNNYSVTLFDGTQFTAEVVEADLGSDLALLKITDPGNNSFTVPAFGDSEKLMIGEKVFAISNMFAQFDHSLSSGVVTGLKRTLQQVGIIHANLIQTNLALPPGSSGGPLFNMNGEVIGINNLTLAENYIISFAIPINTVLDLTESYL